MNSSDKACNTPLKLHKGQLNQTSISAIFTRLEKALESGNVVLAIDGGSGSGKTTLAKALSDIYDCNVIHMDDFFLRPEQRTPERYAEAGGNVDRERFYDEVLIPLSKGDAIEYRRFDCATMTLSPATKIDPKKLTVIEGAYSMHPCFTEFYNLTVFLDIAPNVQKARINKRNTPEMAQRFFNEWIPLEERYFAEMQVKERCDVVIQVLE